MVTHNLNSHVELKRLIWPKMFHYLNEGCTSNHLLIGSHIALFSANYKY